MSGDSSTAGATKVDGDYAGDVSVEEAWSMLQDDPAATLVDVRSAAEWAFVGTPDLGSLEKSPVTIAWQNFPGMITNPFFVAEIKARSVPQDAPLLLKAAAIALTSAGYGPCYNVAGGFEGDRDDKKHRGSVGGWQAAGLPWIQS